MAAVCKDIQFISSDRQQTLLIIKLPEKEGETEEYWPERCWYFMTHGNAKVSLISSKLSLPSDGKIVSTLR